MQKLILKSFWKYKLEANKAVEMARQQMVSI